MDDKWRTYSCEVCRGYGMIWVGDASWDGTASCRCCNEGTVYIRPNGSIFEYPGGPALGIVSKERYEKSNPYLPSCTHGTVFVFNTQCQECDQEFLQDNGYDWRDEDKKIRNERRRTRYAQKKREYEIKSRTSY